MKNILILSFIATFFWANAIGQDKFKINSGAGYYMDVFGSVGGQIIWLEGGAKFKTGFYVNARISMSSINWKISEGAFQGFKTLAQRQMFDLTFSRPVKIAQKHYIEPGLGFKLKKEFHLLPDFQIVNNALFTSYSDVSYDIGLTLCLDYNYVLSNGFFFGLRTDINSIWALGFEGLTIAPMVGFRF